MAARNMDPGASPPPLTLTPPAVTALKEESTPREGTTSTHMERTVSMDIRDEREDLKRAAEQTLVVILELGLDEKVRWLSPTWEDLTGTSAAEIIGKPIAEVVADEENVFAHCVDAIRKDDSKSRIVRFSVKAAGKVLQSQSGSKEAEAADGQSQEQAGDVEPRPTRDEDEQPIVDTIYLEAQGIMVYDRTSGEESHTMWMIKPAVTHELRLDLPTDLVDALGFGAEMLANHLTTLADVGLRDPENHPPPMPILCRICERQITPWWFEKHSELCLEEHKAEREVQDAQEALNEQRTALVRVLDALEAQARAASKSSPPPESGSPSITPKAEYKGLPIGPNSAPSSGNSSARNSPALKPQRSRESSASGLTHQRARSFAVRRPLARIVELILDLCDTAMEISTPAIKDTKAYAPGELRTQSPQSENRIQQVAQWQSPSTGSLEYEQGLSMLCNDTEQLAKAKVDAVLRHRQVLEYAERVRIECDVRVQDCIDTTLKKTARLAAGELSDSSESSHYETPDDQERDELGDDEQDPEETPREPPSMSNSSEMFSSNPFFTSGTASPNAMAMALRDPAMGQRSTSRGSSRASSPHGATTPRSYGFPAESYSFHKRHSIAFESDAGGDSDGSMRSSIASNTYKRADSPSADLALQRAGNSRSRERKRQSLVLSNITSGPRVHSPARGPTAPSSPLRIAKPRIPSDSQSVPSPIVSPVLSSSDFHSPIIRAHHQHHHRRQSSNALSDALGRPSSPRLSGIISNPQPRAVQTSIKDFEVIKPISKGAFGSVYLAKKKSTGDYYAIKVLKKADMVAKNQVNNVKAERHIMMWQGESDFVAKLYWTFSSKDYLYLVMEYLNGGDCASLIKVLGALPEDWTKKYIGEVVLCVQHLHNRQIVHRDLKPDNLLIDGKGHLKLTDFGLSRMGLIGRQKRAINAKPGDAPPDLLKAGPFRRAPSVASSRSTSFDYHGGHESPQHTPAMTPAFVSDLGQPSYFSLTRESSKEPSRRTSGHRSNSGDSEALDNMFRRFSIQEGRTPIEEESGNEGHAGGSDSPEPYSLQLVSSHSSLPKQETPPPQAAPMPPPVMSLFDPEDSDRRFVGTPDYLAPETINGAGQDEMSDWWSLGCILFECLYGRPPFNADTPEEVFQNILNRNIQWPTAEEEDCVSDEAKDLMNKLMCVDPKDRLGSNKDEQFADGGEEIKAHSWFEGIQWGTLREDEASFVPATENPEDTEYFDSRGATMHHFAPEFQDETTSPALTPSADYPDRPHDALSRVRSQVNSVKRGLMPLHIPPHVRDGRSRRLSEPVAADDFGSFQFKNLNVLEKANKDVIQKLRQDAMQAQSKASPTPSTSSQAVVSPSPAPSLESSPVLSMPVNRTLSISKSNNRPQSPSLLSQLSSSPSRGSQPSSPLLVSFTSGQHHERRKTSSGSSSLSQQTSTPAGLQSAASFDQPPRMPISFKPSSNAPSPIKTGKSGSLSSADKPMDPNTSSPRQRSHTIGSQESDLVPGLLPHHYKRRSGVLDVSPSSSDTEETRRQKALLRVQRRRQSSRRLSQISLTDGPSFRTLDVLVCEDHPVSRLVMERLLEKLRCRTIAVTNGSEAMRYAMSEVKFDIIMMEYKLPQVNGADVARMIRDTRNPNSHTPIVAVTGYLKELHAPHYFDALVEKPPTKEKLEEVMGRLCQWKAPPEGWKPSLAQPIPTSNLRQEKLPNDQSPTNTVSSGFTGFSGPGLNSSYRGSSREDSIGSSSLGDADSHYESIPVIISRSATGDWDQSELERSFGGLGISGNNERQSRKPFVTSPPAHLMGQTSAPPSLGTTESSAPRRKPSTETIEAKRQSQEKGRHESAAESGDDEDEELGHISVRARSPRRHVKRTSKLGTEMMRTNSQGSVISNEEIKIPRTSNPEGLLEQKASEVEAKGHLTPPEIFSPQAPHYGEAIQAERSSPPGDLGNTPSADITPKPVHIRDAQPDPDPTPKASVTPAHRD